MTIVPTYTPPAVAPDHAAAVPAPRTARSAFTTQPARSPASRLTAAQPAIQPVEPAQTYTVALARDEDDVRAAQRLRHEVFAAELGAVLHSPTAGLDVDPFDEYCDHLLVREGEDGPVVGTYRLLPPTAARRAGRLYSDGEFDLRNLSPLRDGLVELGRSCIHPDHRGNGAVINLMWGGIARYLADTGNTWVGGCCSIPLDDGGATAARVWDTVSAKHLAPEEYRVTPHRLWDATGVERADRAPLPALLRGYLRLGAWVCGAPAHDPDFATADLYVLLSLERTDPRYLRHFLSGTTAAPGVGGAPGGTGGAVAGAPAAAAARELSA
ncbi:GNAT family N-acyltransferase [Kitasatospora sp. CM 4170]|uniref:GNAT family N-acyltransferase n=1 Tax=Kitasatospora aburaviensis TaxID=67265 RepID=A0ABW1EWF8_9ACTN|nr:GNAT family N-acyltransferase [Kitasatospora sp. CM 4170]WNM43947.1 GNAT family N-acyltransferase [Kitasatospora sp. CM 4170]